MMRARRLLVLVSCLSSLLWFDVDPVAAQGSNASPPSEFSGAATPKDINTRAKAHTELASLYFQSGNLIVALEELTLAISINPNYAQAYAMRGLVLYYVKEFESAEKDFKQALSLNDRDPEIHNNYGWYLCQTGKVKESIDYFLRAIRNPLYQTPEIAHLNAGACYSKLGDLDRAEEYVKKTLRFTPDHPQALFQMAEISYKRANYEAAKERLMTLVQKIESNPEVLWLLLRVERQLGNKAAEASLATQLRRKFPESPEYQALLKGNFE